MFINEMNCEKEGISSIFGRLAAMACMTVLLAGAAPMWSGNAEAAEEAQLVSTCSFDAAALKAVLKTGDNDVKAGDLAISYIVVYSRENPYSGQAFDPSGPTPPTFSGPVLCINNNGVEDVAADVESVSVPNSTNHPGVESIDILENQEAMVLRYELNDDGATAGDGAGPLNGNIENRFCHSSGGKVDCVLVRGQ